MEAAVVGRERELAAVAWLLEAAAGGCAALVLEGEAGIGKTTATVVVHSAAALPPGRYAYKHVATTSRRGERFQMIRIVTVG